MDELFSIILLESETLYSSVLLCAQRPGQPVPVGEVGGEVVLGLQVVEVMVAGPAIQPQRHQTVGGPGQVVTTVVLHRQPDVHHEEGQLGERVAAQQEGVGGGEEAQAESLPGSGVLCGEGGGGGVGMVHLVEVAVEPGHFVVQQVPDEALEVKKQQADQDLGQQARQGRGLLGQEDGPQVPVHHGQREDEDQVVVERQSQAVPH